MRGMAQIPGRLAQARHIVSHPQNLGFLAAQDRGDLLRDAWAALRDARAPLTCGRPCRVIPVPRAVFQAGRAAAPVVMLPRRPRIVVRPLCPTDGDAA